VALGVVLQMLALGVPSSAVRGSTLDSTSPVAITGPGLSQPGLTLRMPVGELDTYPAEGAGTQPTFTPPPTEPAPAYFPPTLYPTLGNSQTSLGNSQSLVEAATVRVASQGGQLTEAEMRALLAEAGAPAEWVPDMLTIAWCESHYSPGAVGDSGNSLGLFQLWSGWARPGEDLFDPLTNARVAVRVREIRGRFGGGGGWSCADLNGIS